MKWAYDPSRKEWVCEHSVGHYDPRYVKDNTHGCDGCCGLESFPPNVKTFPPRLE